LHSEAKRFSFCSSSELSIMTDKNVSGPVDEYRIDEFLQREKLKYQSFVLANGDVTPGYDRSYMNEIVFGQTFKGKSLLDIGSYLGYFCVGAMKRQGHRPLA
jgi:outer membrane protease